MTTEADIQNNNPEMESSEEELGFSSAYINDELFKAILHGMDPKATLVSWRPSTLNTQNSILATMAAADEEIKCFVGHIAYKIQYSLPGEEAGTFHGKHVVLKAKPRGDETTKMLYHVATAIGGEYAKVWECFQDKIGFSNTDHREIEALRLMDKSVKSIRPRIYYTLKDEKKIVFVYVMENFVKEKYTHMDSVQDVSIWSKIDTQDALHDVAEMHARYYGRTSDLPQELLKWIDVQTKGSMTGKLPLWNVALKHNCETFPTVWDTDVRKTMERALSNLSNILDILDASPRTLVHNDFNVRNTCFRPHPLEGEKRLCLYDWELVSLAPPQHDIAEFLSFVLPLEASLTTWQSYVMKYRTFFMDELTKLNTTGTEVAPEFERSLQPDVFQQVFDMSVLELLINRFALYGLPHTFQPYPFLERLIKSAHGYVRKIKDKYPFLMESK